MEHIEDDRSDVLDADDVDRDTGCSRCGTRRVRGGENHWDESDFRGRMALFMLEATWMALVG